MSMTVRAYRQEDLRDMCLIWNEVVEEGRSFPQVEPLDLKQAELFFREQSYAGVADHNGEITGLYILHPNNIGRCGHIANSSYAVKSGQRGKHIGEELVRDSLKQAALLSFQILQFNAVVASNKGAIHLYEKLGFVPLGKIPGGFLMKDGTYEDIIPYYIKL